VTVTVTVAVIAIVEGGAVAVTGQRAMSALALVVGALEPTMTAAPPTTER